MSRLMSKLCLGTVGHRRYRPKRHALSYRVFSLVLDLDELQAVNYSLRLLSIDRPGIISWWQRDHGLGNPDSLKRDIVDMVRQSSQAGPNSIIMLCFPRVLGYAFNPLTTYFCRDASGDLRTVVYEVANTFGGRHFYVVAAGERSNGTYFHTARKAFYVSPFNNVEGDYAFRVAEDGERLAIGVSLKVNDEPLLTAHHVAWPKPLTDRALFAALCRMPLMTLKVIAGIHFEALRLWLKGLRTTRRPKPSAAPSNLTQTQAGPQS